MKLFFPATLVAGALLFNACGDGKADAAKQIAALADSIKAASTHDLSAYQVPLEVVMPEGLPAPVVRPVEETGELLVSAGGHFSMAITEGPLEMDRLKADLERDLLRKNIIVKETSDLLVYRSEFPDDTALVHYHFSKALTADGRTFTIKDAATDEAFSELDVKAMAGAIRPKQPA